MKNTKKQKWIVVLLIGVGLLTAFSGCSEKPPVQPPGPEVTIARPKQENVRRYHDLTGNTESVEMVDVRARVEGFLQEIHFEDGADVKEGDVLFTIERDVFIADVEQAKAVVESTIAESRRAQADLDRVNLAVKTGAVSEQEVDLKRADRDIAVASFAKAKALLKQAELQLSYTTVTSPVTGRVSRRYVDKGNLVGSGEKTLLTRVVRFDPIYVYSNISETLLSQILKKAGKTDQERREVNAKFHVGLADEDGYPHEGVINFIDNRLDETTGTAQIRGTVPNKNRLLYPGMFVRLRIPALEDTAALLVYEKSIGTDLGGKFVLVVGGEDNVVERRYVKLGQLYENMRVVEDGLDANDRYIYKGIQRARPGLPVTPKEESETEEQEPNSK